jgi:hypothetical protein
MMTIDDIRDLFDPLVIAERMGREVQQDEPIKAGDVLHWLGEEAHVGISLGGWCFVEASGSKVRVREPDQRRSPRSGPCCSDHRQRR